MFCIFIISQKRNPANEKGNLIFLKHLPQFTKSKQFIFPNNNKFLVNCECLSIEKQTRTEHKLPLIPNVHEDEFRQVHQNNVATISRYISVMIKPHLKF